jgi:hypothetical protein
LQELLVLAGVVLHLLEDLHSHLLPAVVAPVQIAEAAGSNLQQQMEQQMMQELQKMIGLPKVWHHLS